MALAMMVPGRGWCPQAKFGAISLFLEPLGLHVSGKEQKESLARKSHSGVGRVVFLKMGVLGKKAFMRRWEDTAAMSEEACG